MITRRIVALSAIAPVVRRTILTTCLLFVSIGIASRPARAACLVVSLDSYLSHPGVAAIFSGTVVTVKAIEYRLPENLGVAPGQIATLQVDRVWKGTVKRMTILGFRLGEGDQGLAPQEKYLFIAHRLDAVGREQFGFPPGDDERLGANELGCGAMPFERPIVAELLHGVPGEPPQ